MLMDNSFTQDGAIFSMMSGLEAAGEYGNLHGNEAQGSNINDSTMYYPDWFPLFTNYEENLNVFE